MSKVNLGMKRPIRNFDECYQKLLLLIDEIDMYPPDDELQKDLYIARLKATFNDTIIQLNNIKYAQIELLERGVSNYDC